MTTNKLKTAGLLFAAAMLFSFFAPRVAEAQTGLEVLWQDDSWPTKHNAIPHEFAQFSPDGKSVYFPADTSIPKSNGDLEDVSRVIQISSETGEVISISELTKGSWIRDFNLSEAGNLYVTAQSQGGMNIWDAHKNVVVDSFVDAPFGFLNVVSVAISPDEKTVVFFHAKKITMDEVKTVLAIYDVATKEVIKEIPMGGCVTNMRFSPDGKTLAIGGWGKEMSNDEEYSIERISLWDVASWKSLGTIASNKGFSYGVNRIHFSSDSKQLAAIMSSGCFYYNIETQTLEEFHYTPEGHSPWSITLLPGNNNFIISYATGVTAESYKEVYANGKKVNTYKDDYDYLATNEYEGKYKIFGYHMTELLSGLAVFEASHVSVNEEPSANITIKYSNTNLTITSSGIESQTAKILISDLSGKEVYAGSVEIGCDNAQQLNAPLGIGAYLYQVIGQNKTYSGKFVVGE